MSDDLDLNDLKAAMKAATPAPDAARRAENLTLSRENLDRAQGSMQDKRQTSDAPKRGLFGGVNDMLQTFNARAALTATTAIVGIGVMIYLPQMMQTDGLPDVMPRVDDDAATMPEAAETPAADRAGQPEPAQDAVTLAPAPASESVGRTLQVRKQAAKRETRLQMGGFDGNLQHASPSPSFSLDQDAFRAEPDTEAYPSAEPNSLKVTAENPVSTFSIDVDTASYGVVRDSIRSGRLPNPDAVRIEEMVNYFPYDYAGPADSDLPFATHVTTVQTPWNDGTQLLRIGLQGRMPALEDRPPLNLVFLIDTSGSMNNPRKLPLLKQSFALMLGELREEDSVAIVTYAGSAGQVLAPTPASDRSSIMAALERLDAGGSTAGQQGLQQAYAAAEAMKDDGEVSRVILATDGDFNVGLSDPEALKDYISDKRDSGTYLSVLGFGRGNLDDETMQALAQNGNGQAAYIDTLNEAQKVLVDQLSGALFPIADDVKIQVEFNPAQVAEYRLIGYETRQLNREDFNNDKVDAGEIGAGHSVTALYEITPVGSAARLTDPLRYGEAEAAGDSAELGYLKLRYKNPGEDQSQLIETPIRSGGEMDADMRFAAAVAGVGQLLKDTRYLGDWGWDDAIALANGARGADNFGYRAEAVQLMRLAKSLDFRN